MLTVREVLPPTHTEQWGKAWTFRSARSRLGFDLLYLLVMCPGNDVTYKMGIVTTGLDSEE